MVVDANLHGRLEIHGSVLYLVARSFVGWPLGGIESVRGGL